MKYWVSVLQCTWRPRMVRGNYYGWCFYCDPCHALGVVWFEGRVWMRLLNCLAVRVPVPAISTCKCAVSSNQLLLAALSEKYNEEEMDVIVFDYSLSVCSAVCSLK